MNPLGFRDHTSNLVGRRTVWGGDTLRLGLFFNLTSQRIDQTFDIVARELRRGERRKRESRPTRALWPWAPPRKQGAKTHSASKVPSGKGVMRCLLKPVFHETGSGLAAAVVERMTTDERARERRGGERSIVGVGERGW